MRILLMAPQPFYQNRGTPIAVRLLAEVLGQNGMEVHLLVFHEGEDVQLTNVTIHRIPRMPGLKNVPPGFSVKKIFCDMLLWWASMKLHRRLKFDLVHAVEESVFLARLNKVWFRVPYVYDMDSCLSDQLIAGLPWLRPLQNIFERLESGTVRGSIGVVAVCRALEEMVRGWDRETPLVRLEDISLVDGCGNTEGVRESLRATLGIEGELALYVGNLEAYQGIDLMLAAFSLLLRERQSCDLVVVGGSQQHIAAYRKKAEQLGIADRVHFIGPRPLEKLGDYLCQADVLISPRTKGENTPMKIYSYLDSGRPVVATRIASHTQVMDDTIGVLVEPDPADMARGLQMVLADRESGEILAGAAKKRIAEEFSRPAFEKKLMDFYRIIQEQLSIPTSER